MKTFLAMTFIAAITLPLPAQAQVFGDRGGVRTGAQRSQDRQLAQIPICERPIGSISIIDGDPAAYRAVDLQPPQVLLRVVVQRSGCFTLVDRSSNTLDAIDRERRLASAGALHRDSNLGAGQMRAADYILVAEIASENDDAAGAGVSCQTGKDGRRRSIGGRLGRGVLGAAALAVDPISVLGNAAFSVDSRTSEVNTVISIINVRTSEAVAVSQGYAAKRDINWNLSGTATFGGFVGGGYENTEIGRIVAQSFINAYANVVEAVSDVDLTLTAADMAPAAEDALRASQPADPELQATPVVLSPAGARVLQSATLREKVGGGVLRVMRAGEPVYPTGAFDGEWLEVIDDSEQIGWVQRDRLDLVAD